MAHNLFTNQTWTYSGENQSYIPGIAVENDLVLRKAEQLAFKDDLTGLFNESFIKDCGVPKNGACHDQTHSNNCHIHDAYHHHDVRLS